MASITNNLSLSRLTKTTNYENWNIQKKTFFLTSRFLEGGGSRRFLRTRKDHRILKNPKQNIKRDTIER